MVAAELERTARPGHVHITSTTRDLLPVDQYDFEPGGPIFDESAGVFLDRYAHVALSHCIDGVANDGVRRGGRRPDARSYYVKSKSDANLSVGGQKGSMTHVSGMGTQSPLC